MKDFNLERALDGDPVVTRAGSKIVRLVHLPEALDDGSRIIAVTEHGTVLAAYVNGAMELSSSREDKNDLFMESRREGWINIYPNNISGEKIYKTEESAKNNTGRTLLATVKIEWEE